MKKILAAIDAFHFSEEQMDGFEYIAKEVKGKVTAIFLENIAAQYIPLASAYPELYALNYDPIILESVTERERLMKQQLELFQKMCSNSRIDFNIRESTGYAANEIIAESRFADLLLINNSTSFAAVYETDPPIFVKEVLADAECPVMVLPEKVSPLKEIVFSYNGSYSSTYAIREFTRLFPYFSDMPVNVVYVAEGNSTAIPSEKLIREYLDHHYDEVRFTVLKGEPSTELLGLLINRTDCLVTYGAYNRSKVSRFFHRSDANSVLRTVNIPIFITHP
ncbi:hypothetical protein [Chitinophaga defluvii]|uniref:Universal stress protein family protein n=1 Tax=Chitinophaga defluvii TaxID=3163343 RepID=A0ABV2T2C4_9BACT